MNTEIIKLIVCIDNYLIKTGKNSIGPVEANDILAKAGLLRDSTSRPGKPLRDLLRKGLFPHAIQTGGKGSSWVIPHSKNTYNTLSESKQTNNTNSNSNKIKTTSLVNFSQIETELMNAKHYRNASIIDNIVPCNSGLYCIRISDKNKIPKPFSTYLTERNHNIIYIGIASESLFQRLLNQELRAKGHGTFFRSLGAILGFRPPSGSLVEMSNKKNYRFSSIDTQKIINWINENLIINWVKTDRSLDSFETELIVKYKPLINIAKNPFALAELSELRKLCVQIANEESN